MTRPSTDPNAEFLLSVLRELSVLSGAVLQAGAVGDDAATRTAIDQMRQLRADLQSIGQDTKQQVDDAPAHTKAELEELLANIRQSDVFIGAWCDRYNGLMTQEQLALTPEGRNAILDSLMPATWNWDADILTANDNIDPDFINLALARGQKRIVVFCVSKRDAAQQIPDVRYLSDKKEVYDFFQTLNAGEPKRSVNINSAVAQKVDIVGDQATEYVEFHTEFTNAWRNYLVNKSTIRFHGNRWLMQGLANLPSIAAHATFSSLQDRFIGIPLVIISPGPSLDKNVHLLKQLKGKALLMAPAQTALALSRAGVVPDVIVVADPLDFIYVMDGFPMEHVDALLLGVACHPTFYERYQGKIITFNVNAGIDTWISEIFNDTIRIGSGGSVSTAIFTMGLYLKCNPIVLVGQDLAWANGKQYASNAADGQMLVNLNQESGTFVYQNESLGYENCKEKSGLNGQLDGGEIVMVPAYYGGLVQTKRDYAMFLAEFENHAEIEKTKNNPTRLLNCTEGGAFIRGFEHIPLCDFISEFGGTDHSFSDIFKGIHAAVEVVQRRKLLSQRLQLAKVALEKSYELALRCAKTATQVQRGTAKIVKLTKIESQLVKAIQGSSFIALANQAEISNAIQLGVHAKSIEQSLSASGILYKLVIREAPNILPMVDEALLKLRQFDNN